MACLTLIPLAFGPSITGLWRNLATSLLLNLNADSEKIVSVLSHEAGVALEDTQKEDGEDNFNGYSGHKRTKCQNTETGHT